MVLLLSDAESPACLSCVHFRAILAMDLRDYSCSVIGCPFALWVYKHTLEGQVEFHRSGYTMTSTGSSESLQDTLYVGYSDHDGGLIFLLIIILLVLGLLGCAVTFVQLGYPHFPKAGFTWSTSVLASLQSVTILSHLSYKFLMTPNLCWRG